MQPERKGEGESWPRWNYETLTDLLTKEIKKNAESARVNIFRFKNLE